MPVCPPTIRPDFSVLNSEPIRTAAATTLLIHNTARGNCVIVGLGIDLVDTSRMAREFAHTPWQAGDGIFTAGEISYCNAGRQPEQRYAACFAAKEATLKALGTEVLDLGIFREVEVRFSSGVERTIVLHDRVEAIAKKLGARRLNLSIALATKSVGATVILES